MSAGDLLFGRQNEGVSVAVRLLPKASCNRIIGVAPGSDGRLFLRVAVTQAPEKNKANEALLKLLAKEWGLPTSRLRIARGGKDRRKTIHVAGECDALMPILDRWIESQR